MTIFGKFLFIFIFTFIYTIAFFVARTNSVRAIEKLFIAFFSFALIFSIIFNDMVFFLLSIPLGMERASDAILYLFIIVSTSINLILFRKIIELENKVTEVIKKSAKLNIIK